MARKKTPPEPPEDPINAMAEEASRELQRQADEADKAMRELLSPLWDIAAEELDGEGTL